VLSSIEPEIGSATKISMFSEKCSHAREAMLSHTEVHQFKVGKKKCIRQVGDVCHSEKVPTNSNIV